MASIKYFIILRTGISATESAKSINDKGYVNRKMQSIEVTSVILYAFKPKKNLFIFGFSKILNFVKIFALILQIYLKRKRA